MTEGYKPRTGSDGEYLATAPKLRPANRADLLQTVEYSLKYRHGKPVNTAREVAVAALANTVVDHLELSGYVVMKGPPLANGPSNGEKLESINDRRGNHRAV